MSTKISIILFSRLSKKQGIKILIIIITLTYNYLGKSVYFYFKLSSLTIALFYSSAESLGPLTAQDGVLVLLKEIGYSFGPLALNLSYSPPRLKRCMCYIIGEKWTKAISPVAAPYSICPGPVLLTSSRIV